MKKKLSLFLAIILSVMMLAACGDKDTSTTDAPAEDTAAAAEASQDAQDTQVEPLTKIVFGDAGWDSMKFHNAVAGLIAETVFGYETEVVSGTTAITYTALQTGDIQVYMETWSNGIASYNDDVEQGLVKELSVNFDDNAQGLYVPRYLIEGDAERGIEALAPDLKTVKDLLDYAELFPDPDDTSKSRIIGSISGWEVDGILRLKYEAYGLDELYNYIDPGSDAALQASIASAYAKGEPFVSYYWEPTWITGQYDLVLLEDEPYDEELYSQGLCEYPACTVTICVNPEFSETNPEYCEFLSNYKTSSELTAEALSYLNETECDYAEAAVWFLTEHDELLDQWLTEDQAALVREALA